MGVHHGHDRGRPAATAVEPNHKVGEVTTKEALGWGCHHTPTCPTVYEGAAPQGQAEKVGGWGGWMGSLQQIGPAYPK